MLKERSQVLKKLTILADMIVATLVFLLAWLLRDRISDLYPLTIYLKLVPFFVFIWVGLLYFLGMYGSFRVKPFSDVISIIVEAAAFGFVLFSSVIYVLKLQDISRTFVFTIFLLAIVVFIVEKSALIFSFRYARRKGYNTRSILIVGTGKRAKNFAELVGSHDEWGFKVIGFLDEDPAKSKEAINGPKIIGTFNDLPKILHNSVVDQVVFIVPRLWFEKIEDLIRLCELEGIPASVAVDIYELKFAKAKQSEFLGVPMLTFESAPDRLWELMIKRLLDFAISGLALLLLWPVFIIIAIMIKKTSKGPVFFKQKRCGLNGRRFIFYKFRTMVASAEEKLSELQRFNEMTGPAFKMKNDPRITEVGKFLRKFSIDELPQLWNVFKGHMAIVGPRPPLPHEVNQYDNWQRRRLSMRPGLTCLWQIRGRNKITDFNEWMRLDLEYIDNWSLWLDLKIFFKTIPVVLLAKGAK